MASRRENPSAFDSGRCLLAAGIVFCTCAIALFLPKFPAMLIWAGPVLAGVAVGYRAHRATVPARLGAVLGLLVFEVASLAIEDAVLEEGPDWVGLAFLVAAFWFLAGAAANVASRLTTSVRAQPEYCADCGCELADNGSDRCPECGRLVVRQPGGDIGPES